MWDREELCSRILDVIRRKGQFGLLVGGKNVGKSKLLENLAKEEKLEKLCGISKDKTKPFPLVLYVDCREANVTVETLHAAVLQAAMDHPLLKEAVTRARDAVIARNEKLNFVRRIVRMLSSLFAPAAVGAVADAATDQLETLKLMPPKITFDSIIESTPADHLLTVVIDEANLVLPGADPDGKDKDMSQADRKAIRNLLETLVRLTKQKNQMSALLTTSEHAYPYRLESLRFNLQNFTLKIFAGEVPPNDMRELLICEWGMGPALTDIFMAHYGGHIMLTYTALSAFLVDPDVFDPYEVSFSTDIVRGIRYCIGATNGMHLLSDIATKGLASVGHEYEAAAEAISEKNVGGVVESLRDVVGIHPRMSASVLYNTLLPTYHHARLLIDVVMVAYDKVNVKSRNSSSS